MPKAVDHEKRRRELAAAVWRIILRRGIAGVSIRDVAAEARWSPGALRHYFATGEDLLVFAAQLVAERIAARSNKVVMAATIRDATRALLSEMLPLDDERREEAAVWLAFASHGLTTPRVAEQQARVSAVVRDLCRRVVRDLALRDALAPARDPDQETARLHALLDGLRLQGLLRTLTGDELLAVLDAHLDELIPRT